MFDDNNIDKMMKSILENAQEDVPAHIWEGVSAGLDKVAKRKAVVIWWRRAAIGAAAAAVIVAGLMFTKGGSGQISQSTNPQNGEFIAVVEKPYASDTTSADGVTPPEEVLMAHAETPKTAPSAIYHRPSSITQAQESVSSDVELKSEDEQKAKPEAEHKGKPDTDTGKSVQHPIAEDMFSEDDWQMTAPAKRHKASLVLSSITGTNNLQNSARLGLMKRPSSVSGPAKTGITETSTNTAYGIPVSAGIGVKFDLNDRWSLGVGVNYSYLSRKFYGTYTKADNNGVEISSTSSDIRNSQHFVGIPVNAYCNILNNKHVNLYAYAGGTVEKCLSDKYDVMSTNIVHTEKPEGVQLSANAGIGVEFMLGQHIGLYVDPSLRYYFDNGQPKSIRTTQPLMLGLEMGFRVRL